MTSQILVDSLICLNATLGILGICQVTAHLLSVKREASHAKAWKMPPPPREIPPII